MVATVSIKTLAAKARSFFFFTGAAPKGKRRHLRPNTWLTKSSTPEWVRDMCHAAHEGGSMLPDDTRYSYIVDALEALSEKDEDEARDSIRDGVDIYNHDLYAWLASHGQRAGYVDQAQSDGLVAEDSDISARLSAGQCVEREEVFQSVLDSLQAKAEE